jgi:hypothetical protein
MARIFSLASHARIAYKDCTEAIKPGKRGDNPMTIQIGTEVWVGTKVAHVVEIYEKRGKVAAYSVRFENGDVKKMAAMMVSLPVEFAPADPTAFTNFTAKDRDYYGTVERMFSRSGIGG